MGFGIGVVNATGNEILDNVVMGNTNGIVLLPGVSGNVIRRNLVLGNAPIQISVDHPGTTGVDIRNLATSGQNVFDDNVCVTAQNATCNVDGTPMRLPG